MALVTNYVISPLDGVFVPSGLRRHVLMRKLFDAVLQVATDWAEVTDSSPTPSGIQSWASNLPSTVDNNSLPSVGQFCAAYYTSDPEVSNGLARMFRFYLYITNNLLSFARCEILDPKPQNSIWSYADNDGQSIIQRDAYGGGGNLFNTSSTSGVSYHNYRVIVFQDTGLLIVVFYNQDEQSNKGGFLLYYPDNVSDLDRSLDGFMMVSVLSNDSISTFASVRAPTSGGATDVYLLPHIGFPGASLRTRQNQVPMGPVEVIAMGDAWGLMGQIPRVRVMPANEIALWHRFTVGSTEYVCFAKTQQFAFLIDLTS
jgi:hypothetical protein